MFVLNRSIKCVILYGLSIDCNLLIIISPITNMQHPMVTATANITMMDIPLGMTTPFEFSPSEEPAPKKIT